MTDLRETIANIIERNDWRGYEQQADAVIAALPGAIKPLVWEGRMCRIVPNGLQIHLGPYMVKLWNGKLGARLEYLGHPIEVFPNANGLSLEVKAAAETHHRAQIMAAFDLPEASHD